MSVANLEEVLQPALTNGYAIAGIVILGWEEALASVQAAEEIGVPIILQAGPACRKYTPIPVLGAMFRHLAENSAIQVVSHLDHAYSYQECKDGIDCGFTSVMYDGSSLRLEENIQISKEIVNYAKTHDVSVEGEVGYVGYDGGNTSKYTDPEEAGKFAHETGVSALAVSIGNVHLKTEQDTQVNFEVLKQIEDSTPELPLVMHGSSGIEVDDRKRLAKTKVSKFNVGTEIRKLFGSTLRKSIADQQDEFDRIALLKPTIPVLKSHIKQIIQELRFL